MGIHVKLCSLQHFALEASLLEKGTRILNTVKLFLLAKG